MTTAVVNRTLTPAAHFFIGVFGNLTNTEQAMSEDELRRHAEAILDTLPTKGQKELLMVRYGFNGAPIPKIEDAGAQLGLSRQEARRLEDGAISWLHHITCKDVKFARRTK